MATDVWLALAACVLLLVSLVVQVRALVKGPGTRRVSVTMLVARAGATMS